MVSSSAAPVEVVDLARYRKLVAGADPIKVNGRVTQVIGLVIESHGPAASIGELCHIWTRSAPQPIQAEVVGFRDDKVLLMPLGEMAGIEAGSEVVAMGRPLTVRVGDELLGRVLDGLGRPMDGKEPLLSGREVSVFNVPPNPLARARITSPLTLGVRAIDGILTCGKGQRVGIFAGSGVGKSTLIGIVARNTEADVNVIALIGERGREVRDFIEKDLGEDGLKRSVVIAATSDQPALIRIKGAMVATAVAEYFRDRGKHVILMMDSITRFAMAQREVGLAIGEPPATRGYTPSVFAALPKLLERSGTAQRGTITGLYTVLVDGDDMNEPVADTARSILDGHIVLSRDLASANHYPPIDVLASVSRVMPDITSTEQQAAANTVRDVLAAYREAQDLINIGAYVSGSNPRVDRAISMIDRVNAFLRQGTHEACDYATTIEALLGLARDAGKEACAREEIQVPAGSGAHHQKDTGGRSQAPARRPA